MAAETRVNRLKRVSLVSASGLAASGLSFIVFALAGRRLSLEDFGDFAAIWGVIFGAASILGAFELEAARRSASSSGSLGNLPGLALRASVVLAGVSLVGAPLISSVLGTELITAFAVPVAVVFYPLFFVARGRIAGLDHLGQYAGISLLEGLLRPVTMAALGAAAAWQFTWAAASGAAAWLPWAPRLARSTAVPRLPESISGESLIETARKVGILMSGNVAGAILITGMPATLTLVLGDADRVGIATAVVLASVSRAPLILLQSVYGLLVPWFIRMGSSNLSKQFGAHWLVALLGGVGLALFGASALVVSVDLLFGGRYQIGFTLSLAFLLGTLLLGVVQIMTARLVARDRHQLVQAMWWSTTIVAISVMIGGRVAGFPASWTVAAAQGVGPLAGLTIASRVLRHD